MSEKEKKPTIKWLEKFKNIKHIELYVAIIFVVILLLIYFSNFKSNEKTTSVSKTNDMSVASYVDDLESNLEDILSKISGISDVKVMITLNLNEMEVVDSKLSITKMPAIKGILVTAKGVNNTANKLKVLHAIQAVIDINNGNIEILSSE